MSELFKIISYSFFVFIFLVILMIQFNENNFLLAREVSIY